MEEILQATLSHDSPSIVAKPLALEARTPFGSDEHRYSPEISSTMLGKRPLLERALSMETYLSEVENAQSKLL